MQFLKKKDNLYIEYYPKINGENLNLMELQKGDVSEKFSISTQFFEKCLTLTRC